MNIEDFFPDGPTPGGRGLAVLPLVCPYCGKSEIEPTLEYSGYAYSEHRDWTGTECGHCGAEWERDGTPRQGPYSYAFPADGDEA